MQVGTGSGRFWLHATLRPGAYDQQLGVGRRFIVTWHRWGLYVKGARAYRTFSERNGLHPLHRLGPVVWRLFTPAGPR